METQKRWKTRSKYINKWKKVRKTDWSVNWEEGGKDENQLRRRSDGIVLEYTGDDGLVMMRYKVYVKTTNTEHNMRQKAEKCFDIT